MKKYGNLWQVCLVLVVSFAFLLTPALAANERVIQVNGFAQRSITPDIAFIQVGVVTQASNVETARAENAAIIKKVAQRLGDFNIVAKDIQTSNFSLQPVYAKVQNYEQEREIIGYKVENTLLIRLKDIASVGRVIDVTFAAGANRFDGITFSASNTEKIKEELLKEAVKDGYKKAKIVADMSGSTIGVLVNASIRNNSVSNKMLTERAYMEDSAAGATEIFSGSMSISVNVDLTYLLE